MTLTAHHFIDLEDLILPPPLPALLSVLIVSGTVNLATRVGKWLQIERESAIELAATFAVTAGLIAAAVHALAWAGFASVSVLRPLGWLLAVLGVVQLSTLRLGKLTEELREYWRGASRIERFAVTVASFVLVGLFAAALGPAVDADSLEYHLAVPLDWLRHGGAYPRPDWLKARYVGLGESLNMLGLAAGTDGLGAAFQAAGLVVALIAVSALARTGPDRLFAVLLVVSCPVIVPLVMNQKPQMFPAAALTLGLVLFVKHFEAFDLKAALLAFGCVAFATASKYSFLLSGAVVAVVGLASAARARCLPMAVLVLAGCLAVLALPVFARNFIFYGDPISPLLEKWRPGGDPAIVAYAQQHLRDYGGPVTLDKFLRLPLELVVTPKIGLIHEALGLGLFAFLLAVPEKGAPRGLLVSALAASVLVVALGQPTPRFFLEPYFWCAAAAAGAVGLRRAKGKFFMALAAQAIVVAAVALYQGAIAFPGALTRTQRERVMQLLARDYAAAKWLDAILPSDAVAVAEFPSLALFPRSFLVGDWFGFADESMWKERLVKLLSERQVTVLVSPRPIGNRAYRWLAEQYGEPLAGPARFPTAARSPFNRTGLSEWIVFRIKTPAS